MNLDEIYEAALGAYDQIISTVDPLYLLGPIFGCIALIVLIGRTGGISGIGGDVYIIKPLWTAYYKPIISLYFYCLIFILIGYFYEAFRLNIYGNDVVNLEFARLILFLFIILKHAIWIYAVRRRYMRIDEDGVWYYKGIFPWTVTIDGLTWKNLEYSWIIQGFVSWVLRSWTVRVVHRYNSDKRFEVRHMPQEAVALINNMAKREPN